MGGAALTTEPVGRPLERRRGARARLGGMAAVSGFGGAFIRADDPDALSRWYQRHLGLTSAGGAFTFPAAEQPGPVALAFFRRDDEYFPLAQPVMLNLQVDDLDVVLDRLIAEGVEVDPRRDDHDFGRFGWFTDPEGNRVELWQPAPSS